DFARTRAVAELDSRNRKHALADRLLDQRLALIGNLVKAPLDQSRSWDDEGQNGAHKSPKHRLELARRPGQQEEMRRLNPGIDIRPQIKTGRAPILVRQDLCACGNVRLTRNARSPFDSAHLKSLLERRQQVRRLLELQP